MLALLPRHDSLCGHLQLKNALCFPRLYCFARCIQTIRTWRIFACHLALCSYWWTWLCWSGFWCVCRRRWLGVQINLLMKWSNASCTWGLSSVVFNWEACLFPYPLLPWIGGLHFIILLPILPFVAVSFWRVLTRPMLPVLFAPFFGPGSAGWWRRRCSCVWPHVACWHACAHCRSEGCSSSALFEPFCQLIPVLKCFLH